MLGMEMIWKNTQSGLGEPKSNDWERGYEADKQLLFQTCSCLSWTAGLTWSLVGFPLHVSDTCLDQVSQVSTCTSFKENIYREKEAAFLRAPPTVTSESCGCSLTCIACSKMVKASGWKWNIPGIEMRRGEVLRGACQDGEMAIEKTRQTEDETCAALRGN